MPRIVVGVGAGLMEIERGVVMVALGGLVWLRWWGGGAVGIQRGAVVVGGGKGCGCYIYGLVEGVLALSMLHSFR